MKIREVNPLHWCLLAVMVSMASSSCTKEAKLSGDHAKADLEGSKPVENSAQVDDVTTAATVLSTVYKGITITFHQNYAVGTVNSGRGAANYYDYSGFMMLDQSTTQYRLYHGGRYLDAYSDGDNIFSRRVIKTGGGSLANWNSTASYVEPALNPTATVHPSAFWRQPEDVGYDPHIWDSGNFLEPECIRVGGLYYLFSQVEIRPGDYIDFPATEVAGPSPADRIRLHTSVNGGSQWQKVFPGGVNRGVVYNLPAATRRQIKLTHQEMIYEPGTDKPWVMYVFWQNNGVNQGHVRIRSADPGTFDWPTREACSGMAQLGNQIGYTDVPKSGGGTARLYFRITMASDNGHLVPSFQFSSDGLIWGFGSATLKLVGHPTLNNYFLGFSTVDGTGQLPPEGAANNYNMLYVSSAAVGSGNADIWNSDIWMGKTQMQLTGTLTP
ncbi:hypothetical protein HDC92_001304 [Pedobacter sp. AK017]|nr:hypothetical protein [Pedobacter sp. AK017]MBB5437632.1 hypothetical protein [Pedobacter sp. AK017]